MFVLDPKLIILFPSSSHQLWVLISSILISPFLDINLIPFFPFHNLNNKLLSFFSSYTLVALPWLIHISIIFLFCFSFRLWFFKITAKQRYLFGICYIFSQSLVIIPSGLCSFALSLYTFKKISLTAFLGNILSGNQLWGT